MAASAHRDIKPSGDITPTCSGSAYLSKSEARRAVVNVAGFCAIGVSVDWLQKEERDVGKFDIHKIISIEI